MRDGVVDREGPGWLGLGWVGSGVVAGAALGGVAGAATGGFASRLSDTPPDVATHEVSVVAGAVIGAAALFPVGVLLGLVLGLVLRGLARRDAVTRWRAALSGVAVGGGLVPLLAVMLGVVAEPSTAPGLPSPLVAAPALAAAGLGCGLALLMRRSATRLGAWPS